ncbi:MAG: hypothetical protein Q4D38_15115 [Planctomycetia bacterium]|nr:hypothetical protein [Planctomycetia bacterium]
MDDFMCNFDLTESEMQDSLVDDFEAEVWHPEVSHTDMDLFENVADTTDTVDDNPEMGLNLQPPSKANQIRHLVGK